MASLEGRTIARAKKKGATGKERDCHPRRAGLPAGGNEIYCAGATFSALAMRSATASFATVPVLIVSSGSPSMS